MNGDVPSTKISIDRKGKKKIIILVRYLLISLISKIIC